MHDRLALDLTTLANERTLLAYIRTALALAAAGAALVARFLGNHWSLAATGWILIGLGVLTAAVFGVARYVHVRRTLRTEWGEGGRQ